MSIVLVSGRPVGLKVYVSWDCYRIGITFFSLSSKAEKISFRGGQGKKNTFEGKNLNFITFYFKILSFSRRARITLSSSFMTCHPP